MSGTHLYWRVTGLFKIKIWGFWKNNFFIVCRVSGIENNLSKGTAEDVVKETIDYLKIGAQGGRFWLTSAYEIHQDVKPENLKALVKVARLYGVSTGS